jgi:hypothetical protein
VERRWDADAALTRQSSIVEDVRTFRFGVDEPAPLFVQVARSVAPVVTGIAIDLSSRAIPFAFGNALAQGWRAGIWWTSPRIWRGSGPRRRR